jgi:hypothetical protein
MKYTTKFVLKKIRELYTIFGLYHIKVGIPFKKKTRSKPNLVSLKTKTDFLKVSQSMSFILNRAEPKLGWIVVHVLPHVLIFDEERGI